MDSQIEELTTRIENIEKSLDQDALHSRKGELQTKSMEENFWKDPSAAQSIMREITQIEETLKGIDDLKKSLKNISEYWTLAKEEEDSSAQKDLKKDAEALEISVGEFELHQFLSGSHDNKDALLSIHAGQGGTEANDWAEMLMRMYLRYAEKRGWDTDVLHMLKGDEAGISTVTIEISGANAFGFLKHEKGTHRLVRLSPFNAQNLRQTSFAGVEVLPVLEDTDSSELEIPEGEIEFKASRASGPGGQHVNKTSTAVTLTHIPTGITVHSSSQRSQHQNRDAAMKLLRAKLWEIEEEKRTAEKAKLKGEHKVAAWGNQIRNYVLHPYKLVKDLRTDIEHPDPEAVLDGELDEFITAEIRTLAS